MAVTVVPAGRARVGVPRGVLNVAQRHAGVAGERDHRRPQAVGTKPSEPVRARMRARSRRRQ